MGFRGLGVWPEDPRWVWGFGCRGSGIRLWGYGV